MLIEGLVVFYSAGVMAICVQLKFDMASLILYPGQLVWFY
jgi:hypothetical protein